MRAMVLPALGDLDALAMGDLPVPAPAPGEVLVRVATVAANRQDIVTALGRFPNPDLRLPHVLGMDPAGVVVAVGEGVRAPAVGTRVVARPAIACGACPPCRAGDDDACDRAKSLGVHRPGGMGEFVAVPAPNAVPIPDSLSFATATTVAHTFPVALTALRRVGLRAGETVLVLGAAGALGSAAVQLAAQAGARVVAIAGGSGARAWLEELPPSARPAHVIDHLATEDLGAAIRAAAPAGVDLLVETASDPARWPITLHAVARHGRVAVLGAHAGPTVEVNLNWLFRQRVSIIGCAGSSMAAFRDALALVAAGSLTPRIDSVMPLADARAALARLQARQNAGKVVLRVADLPEPTPDPSA